MIMKLHVGCGKRYLEGWKHLDLLDLPHIDYRTSAEKMDMISEQSVDCIYACHVLEHFGRHDSNAVFDEFYRVLKKVDIYI